MDKTKHPARRKNAVHVAIRQMEIDDFANVFHLGEKLFSAERVPNLYRTWDEFEVISMYQGDPEFCLVAEVDTRIIGFALGTTISKSHSAWKYGHLVWLAVEPGFQRKNIGTRLFTRFRDLMLESGVRMLIVDTEMDDLPALRFFLKMGFGNPEEHMYLTLNLAAQRRVSAGKKQHVKTQTMSRRENDG